MAEQIQKELGANAVPLTIPIGAESDFKGIRRHMEHYGLCEYDSADNELIVECDGMFMDDLRGEYINDEEYQVLLDKCDLIKFYI